MIADFDALALAFFAGFALATTVLAFVARLDELARRRR